MSQNSVVVPTSGIVSGVTMAQDINNAFDAGRTMWSGASAPSADAPEFGQLWLNTSNNSVNFYDGTNWLLIAYLDLTNHIWAPPVGGDSQSVASASTTTLGGSPSVGAALQTITGNTTINSFGSSAIIGQVFFIVFSGALTVTYNATSMILPGQANIVTTAGDMAMVVYLGSGNWRMLFYQPIGTLIGAVGTISGAFVTNNIVSPSQITSNQNDYAPTGNVNAAVLELTSDGLADYLITGIANGTSGRHLIVRNANSSGGGRFYFPNQSTSSLAANRFKMPGVVQLNPGQQVEFIYDNSSTAWVPQNVVVAQPTFAGYRKLKVGNVTMPNFTAPATPTNQYKITADALTLWDADNNSVTLSNVSVTADLTVTGANGIDSTANAGFSTGHWYSAWVIYNAITNTVAALASTTITSPTMPSGYTFKARCGWAATTFSTTKNLARAFQSNEIAGWIIGSSVPSTYPLVASGPSGLSGLTSVSVASYVPPVAESFLGILAIAANPAGAGSASVAPSTQFSVGSNAPAVVASLNFGSSAGISASIPVDIPIESTALNIAYYNDSNGDGFLYSRGWRGI